MKLIDRIKRLFGGGKLSPENGGELPGEEGSEGVGQGAEDNSSGLKSFWYSFDGTIGGNNYSYELKDVDGRVVFGYESMEHRDYGRMEKVVDPSVSDAMYKIYVSHRIAAWNGFHKHNSMICDGEGFSLSMSFKDGRTLSAGGSNSFPKRYGDFVRSMKEVLDPIRDELLDEARRARIERGISGKVNFVMVNFIQRGKCGSDRHEFLLTRKGSWRKNLDVKVKSDSGKFFPKGETRVNADIPDEAEAELFDAIQELAEKYELIRWYDFDGTDPDYNNCEWFQLDMGFDSGEYINAMGTLHPVNYDDFRKDFLVLLGRVTAKYCGGSADNTGGE